jgi:hypothetical protein
MELAHPIGLLKKIVPQKSLICPVSPARSPRSLKGLIQVHPDGNALPATVPRNRGTLERPNQIGVNW